MELFSGKRERPAVVAEVRRWERASREWEQECQVLMEAGLWQCTVEKPMRVRAAGAVRAWRLPTRRRRWGCEGVVAATGPHAIKQHHLAITG